MESSPGDSTAKKHSRIGSASRARRSTRGPLDIADPTNPLASPTLANQPSSLLSSQSQYHTPRMPSPAPGSNLSTLSFKTAHSTLTTPQKDFTYLLRPEIYHPLTLLDVPPPFRTPTSQPDPSTPLPLLLQSAHYRSAAIKAAQLLTGTPPPSTPEIFSLLYTRLACLTLTNATALAAQEVKALEDLTSSYYRSDDTGTHLVPWALRVLAVRLQGMGYADARRGVMGFYELAREARSTLTGLKKSLISSPVLSDEREVLEIEVAVWEQRLSELGIRVASALIEMEDLEGAARFLSTLSNSPELNTQKALLWLCLGDVEAARVCVGSESEGGGVIGALAAMADGEFEGAVGVWRALVDGDGEEKGMWRQNLGVCLLYLGRMDEAKEALEGLVEDGNSFHALTFNLSTIYELCTERSRALKIGLAEKVAEMMVEKRSGGVGGEIGGEKVNGDFKL